MCSAANDSPVFPPFWFVQQWNTAPHRRGKPYLTGLDPLVMLAWHLVTQDLNQPLVRITGC